MCDLLSAQCSQQQQQQQQERAQAVTAVPGGSQERSLESLTVMWQESMPPTFRLPTDGLRRGSGLRASEEEPLWPPGLA